MLFCFFFTISKIIQFRAIKESDLSSVYPIISIGPIFTLFYAILPPLREIPSLYAIIGIVITVVGLYFSRLESLKEGILKPFLKLFSTKSSLLLMLSVVMNSSLVIFDKMGINNISNDNTTFVLLIENLVFLILFFPVLVYRNKDIAKRIKPNLKILLLSAFLAAINAIIGFYAIGKGEVSVVTTVRNTQLLFILLFSYIFLKEKLKIQTIIGSVLIVIGIVFIKLGI